MSYENDDEDEIGTYNGPYYLEEVTYENPLHAGDSTARTEDSQIE